LRLNTGTVKGNFVNIHVLVSPDDPNHVFELNRFLGRLVFSGFSDKFACMPGDLRRLGRLAGGATLDDEAALRHGAGQFKVSLDTCSTAIAISRGRRTTFSLPSPRPPVARRASRKRATRRCGKKSRRPVT
jgi:hypothetical protein